MGTDHGVDSPGVLSPGCQKGFGDCGVIAHPLFIGSIFSGCVVERSGAIVVPRIDVRTRSYQGFDLRDFSARGSAVKRGAAASIISRIEVRPRCYEGRYAAAADYSMVQRSMAVVISCVDVRPGRHERFKDCRADPSVVQRCAALAVSRVDVCTRGD